jgi:succinoglycan biosynthesis protein ExoM
MGIARTSADPTHPLHGPGGLASEIVPAEEACNTSIDVSIVIPTLRRQALLPPLLERINGQLECENVQTEMIIVDNCPQESAKPVVMELRRRYGPAVRYISDKRPGVSHVRNTGVHAARGHIVVFIDDDELPGDGWLASMLDCRKRYGADVVLGPVYPIFDVPDAAGDAIFRKTFTQSSERPTGATVEPRSPARVLLGRGSCYRTMATSNALVEKRHCVTSDEPFAPALGRLGGEDLLFFHNLYLSGKRFVWCREAAVFERVPDERLDMGYVLGRRFRDGQITSVTCLMTTPRQYRRLILSMTVGLIQLVLGAGSCLVFAAAHSKRIKAAMCAVAAGAGKLLWMRRFHHRSYGLVDAAEPSRAAPAHMQ